jgi:hypothetical protein
MFLVSVSLTNLIKQGFSPAPFKSRALVVRFPKHSKLFIRTPVFYHLLVA